MSGRARLAAALSVTALAAACGAASAQPAAASPGCRLPSLEQRVVVAARIYGQVVRYFPELRSDRFDAAHAAYAASAVRAEGRRELALASMELLASLGDGHTWFVDQCLDRKAQPVGLVAYPLAGRWTVVRSARDAIRPGDVIVAVDGAPIDHFFARHRRYISASSRREAEMGLFDLAVLFPLRFRLTLAGGRQVVVDRSIAPRRAPEPRSQGRWLVADRVAYIAIPTLQGLATQVQAIELLERYRAARTIVVDLRDNLGGGLALAFKPALMDRPYRSWTESAALGGGLARSYGSGDSPAATATSRGATVRPRGAMYGGRLILLVDRRCASGCEDLVMPFKTTGRATVIGETTAGAYALTARTDLGDGMLLNVTSVRFAFPDGSRFEGAGIRPDIEVATTAEDLARSRDPVLDKALELAGR